MVISICSDKSFDEVKSIVKTHHLTIKQTGGASKKNCL